MTTMNNKPNIQAGHYSRLSNVDKYFARREAEQSSLHLPQEYARLSWEVRDAMRADGIELEYVEARAFYDDNSLLHRSEIVRDTYEV